MTKSKLFPWVPDGTYDMREYLVRYQIRDGNPVIVISKMWVDKGGPSDVSYELRLEWGAYPDFPPKPAKK